MYEDNRKNILCSKIDYTFLSLISNKINVLIVGGGKASIIKTKTFLNKGCKVSVLSKEFILEFNNLNINKIQGIYDKIYLDKYHLIVIATNDEKLNEIIRNDCDSLYKLYIDCSDFTKGTCITPCQRNTENIGFGLNTQGASPKTSIYISNKIKDYSAQFDEFVQFTVYVRNKLKGHSKKNEIMEFICSDDFLFFSKKQKHKEIFKMFYDIEL